MTYKTGEPAKTPRSRRLPGGYISTPGGQPPGGWLQAGSRTAERLPLSVLQGGIAPQRVPLEYARNEVGLGVKDIDGFMARGIRTITTIPTDQVGNSKPIEIVDERWESTELKVLLRSLHRDPRSGDIEYALTKVSRTEPPASLFQVPSGYTIRD